jgi:hypothetical protein
MCKVLPSAKEVSLMTRKLNVGLSLAAGLFGGLLSHYVTPPPVHAQAEVVPQEVKAHNFLLVNDAGKTTGVFGIDPDGNAQVTLLDKAGKVIWSSRGNATLKPLIAANQK